MNRAPTFRLSTLLIAISCLAGLLVLWRIFPVTGIELRGNAVVVHMADRYGQHLATELPYLKELAESPDVYLHDVYMSIRLDAAILGAVVILLVLVAAISLWRRFVRQRRAG